MTGTRRRSASEWAALVSEFQASGEPEAVFCERKGLALGTFRKWRYEQGVRSDGRRRTAKQRSDFIQLVPSSASRTGGVIVHVGGGVHIECPGHMDIESVAQLVRAVRDER